MEAADPEESESASEDAVSQDAASEDDDVMDFSTGVEEARWHDSRLCSFDVALKRVGGSASLVLELLPGWVATLRDAATCDDIDTLRRMAHTIKNSADNVGATLVVELAWEFEKSAATEGVAPEPHRVEELKTLVGRLLDELRVWQVAEAAVSA